MMSYIPKVDDEVFVTPVFVFPHEDEQYNTHAILSNANSIFIALNLHLKRDSRHIIQKKHKSIICIACTIIILFIHDIMKIGM